MNLSSLSFEISRNHNSIQIHTLYRFMHDFMNYVRNLIFESHTCTPVVCPRHINEQIGIAISRCAMWPLDIRRYVSISNFSQQPRSGTSNDCELLCTGTHCIKTPRYRVIWNVCLSKRITSSWLLNLCAGGRCISVKGPIYSKLNCVKKKLHEKLNWMFSATAEVFHQVFQFFVSCMCLLLRVTVLDKNKAVVCCLLATSAIMLSEKKKRKRNMRSK
jgi:hypothetical protein